MAGEASRWFVLKTFKDTIFAAATWGQETTVGTNNKQTENGGKEEIRKRDIWKMRPFKSSCIYEKIEKTMHVPKGRIMLRKYLRRC